MPIYDYVCSNCGHLTEVVHGIHDSGPKFCPECGAEGTMTKAFAPPAIVFKGSGWAKKDRSSTAKPAAARKDEPAKSGSSSSDSQSGSDTSSGASGSSPSASSSSSTSSSSNSSGGASPGASSGD